MGQIEDAIDAGLDVRTRHLTICLGPESDPLEVQTLCIYASRGKTGRVTGIAFVSAGDVSGGDDNATFVLSAIDGEGSHNLLDWNSEGGFNAGDLNNIELGDGFVLADDARVFLDVMKNGIGVTLPSLTIFVDILPDLASTP